MKKIYTIALLIAALGLASCSRDEDSLFDRSAAERVQDLQTSCATTLKSASNGWEMLYFPNPDAAGYAFLCKFHNDGTVTFAAKNSISTASKYAEETSLWTTCGNQGAVLSFNSYNKIFHEFSDPLSDGVGYEGDYEFVILKVSSTEIRLKGKKHSAYIVMHPLAKSQDWQDYFAQIDKFNAAVFDGNNGIDMNYYNKDSLLYKMTYQDGQFTYTKNNKEYAIGFIISPTGLHFYSGSPMLDGSVAKNFVISDDQTCLVSTDKPNAYFTGNYSAADFFILRFEKKARWIYLDENSDAATVAAVKALKDTVSAKGATITRIAYDRYTTTISDKQSTTNYDLYVCYSVSGKVFEGRILLNYSKSSDGKLRFSFKSVDSSLASLLKRLNDNQTTAAKMFTSIFCGEFTPSSYSGSQLNMSQLYLSDGTRKIHVIADGETK